jgi:DNA polymerase-3 subunit alpha
LKVLIKEGWVNQEGKKGDPRMQFQLVQYLQDVLPTFAKKLIIRMDIADLQNQLIQQLDAIFKVNKGDNQVSFEVMELETVKKEIIEVAPTAVAIEAPQIDPETELIVEEESEMVTPTATEEIRVVTSITLPSRKLKIKISNELLNELEKMQLNFKLN